MMLTESGGRGGAFELRDIPVSITIYLCHAVRNGMVDPSGRGSALPSGRHGNKP